MPSRFADYLNKNRALWRRTEWVLDLRGRLFKATTAGMQRLAVIDNHPPALQSPVIYMPEVGSGWSVAGAGCAEQLLGSRGYLAVELPTQDARERFATEHSSFTMQAG